MNYEYSNLLVELLIREFYIYMDDLKPFLDEITRMTEKEFSLKYGSKKYIDFTIKNKGKIRLNFHRASSRIVFTNIEKIR